MYCTPYIETSVADSYFKEGKKKLHQGQNLPSPTKISAPGSKYTRGVTEEHITNKERLYAPHESFFHKGQILRAGIYPPRFDSSGVHICPLCPTAPYAFELT